MPVAFSLLGRFALVSSLMVGACPALSQVTAYGLKITSIRAYTDGNLHIFFSKPISASCGGRLRVLPEAGQDSVRTVALSAMMSGRAVTVESASVPTNKICNLTYIRILDQ